MLPVSDGNTIYWEVRGNPGGKPAVCLSPTSRRCGRFSTLIGGLCPGHGSGYESVSSVVTAAVASFAG